MSWKDRIKTFTNNSDMQEHIISNAAVTSDPKFLLASNILSGIYANSSNKYINLNVKDKAIMALQGAEELLEEFHKNVS